MAASHMKHIHPVENNEQETGCPICPKTFTKIDHLKNHVWRHVNRVIPGMVDPKRSQTKVLFIFRYIL